MPPSNNVEILSLSDARFSRRFTKYVPKPSWGN